MKRTTIYLPEDLVVEIKLVSTQDRRSEADLIREALRTYLAERRPPLPSFVGMVSDKGFRARDDEQYLEEHWKPD